jgi:hypothetical protein
MVTTSPQDSRSKGTGKLAPGRDEKSFLPFLVEVILKTANGRRRVELWKLQHELLLRGWHP